jgi:DNA-binding MurR/RpiR family transcriptional regulator
LEGRQEQTGEASQGESMPAITQAIAEHYEQLSPAQRQVIDHLFTDMRTAAFFSARELAQQTGVSTSIVTRAAQALGYAGYPELRAQLREEFGLLPQRIASTITDLGETPETAALQSMEEDLEILRLTRDRLSIESLHEGVELLLAARRVYIFGAYSSFGLAQLLAVGLRLALSELYLFGQAAGDLSDQLALLCKDDVLVAIGFRRLDRTTVQVVQQAKQKGVRVLGITDHPSTTIGRMADVVYIVPSRSLRLSPPSPATASLINALITAVSLRNRAVAEPRYREAEALRVQFGDLEQS